MTDLEKVEPNEINKNEKKKKEKKVFSKPYSLS